jgi:hypothetical protein
MTCAATRLDLRLDQEDKYIFSQAAALDPAIHTRAAYAFVVDAKNAEAKAFYTHFGFKPLGGHALKMYLPLGFRDAAFPLT